MVDSNVKVDNIALFGSALSQSMDADSDLDLIIVSEDFVNKDLFERSEMIARAETVTIRKFMIPLDILTMTPEEYSQSLEKKRIYSELVE